MKINAKLVIELRRSKYWSQDELAVAAGLNLRTVQRIESDGSASLQSKKALASAFNIEAGDLDYVERPTIMKYEYKIISFDVKGLFSRKISSPDIEKELNEYGSEGWKLIKMSEISADVGNTVKMVATMERPIH